MKFSKVLARKIIFPFFHSIGINKILRIIGRPKLLFVMYHGVVDEDSNYFSPRHLQKNQFEKHLQYLSKNFDIISADKAFEILKSKTKLKRNTLVVTFDDGFQNNLYVAQPLLTRYNIPVIYFISSYCADDNEPTFLWSEIIAAIKYFNRNDVIKINGYEFVDFYDSKHEITINDYIKQLPCAERDIVLNKLEIDFDIQSKLEMIPKEVWRLMDKAELIQLSKIKNVSIGSHSHAHYNLGNIAIIDAEKDIIYSKKMLEDTLKIEITSFAYPDGSYNEEVKNCVEKSGFKNQYAVNYSQENDARDIRIVNRHGISSGTTFESNMFFLHLALKNKGFTIPI